MKLGAQHIFITSARATGLDVRFLAPEQDIERDAQGVKQQVASRCRPRSADPTRMRINEDTQRRARDKGLDSMWRLVQGALRLDLDLRLRNASSAADADHAYVGGKKRMLTHARRQHLTTSQCYRWRCSVALVKVLTVVLSGASNSRSKFRYGLNALCLLDRATSGQYMHVAGH